MQHGLTPQLVCFERRKIDSVWKLVTHGDNVGSGIFYDRETATRVTIILAEPAYYLIFAQVLTGGQTTILQITNPTAGLIWQTRQWTRTDFPQINSLTVVSPGTADPAYTILTRAFCPFMHAGAGWLLATDAQNVNLQIDVTSGINVNDQPLLIGIWKLLNGQQQTTQHANILYGAAFSTSGGASCVALSSPDDVFWSIPSDAIRYQVTASGSSGAITFGTLTTADRSTFVFAGTFTHEIVVRIASIPGETTTGDVTLYATLSTGAVAVSATLTYGPSQTVYTFAISAGAVNAVSLLNIAAADRFEFEILLNVTN
jgi:hypothetical protein